MVRWLSAAVLVAPFVVAPAAWGLSIAEAKNLAFLVFGALAIIALVANLWLRLLLAWTLVGFFVAGQHRWALVGVLGIFAWALGFYLARAHCAPSEWPKLRLAVAVSALAQVAWALLQRFGHDPVFVPLRTEGGYQPAYVEPQGWFGNRMDLALYLGLALPMIAAVHPVLGPALAALTALVMLVFLPTTAGAVAIGITVVWWITTRTRSRALGLLTLAATGLAGGLYLWRFDPQGAGLRPLIWQQLTHLIEHRPVLGWGPNALDHRVILVTPSINNRWNFGFNEYLQGAMELGVPAVACALAFLLTTFWALRRHLHEAGELVPALLILVVAAGFSIPFRVGPVALLAALVLGQLERRLA